MVVSGGRGAKQKGREAEKEFASILNAYIPAARAKRMPLSGAVKGFDGDIHTKLDLLIEVKRQERFNIWQSWAQLTRAGEGLYSKLKILAFRKNNHEWLLTMSLKDFLELYSHYLELQEEQ